jgi:hypothetical protein
MYRAPRIDRTGRRRELPFALREVLASELGTELRIGNLCGEFLGRPRYHRPLAHALVTAASGRGGESWEERRLAVVLLEVQIASLAPRELAELEVILGALGVITRALPASLLLEGYSSTDLPRFAGELRHRLLPARRAANRLAGYSTTPESWSDFLAFARAEHRLPLARYVFSPAEVVERVRRQVRISRGVADPLPARPADAAREARRRLAELPPYEAEICRLLVRDAAIYWVGEETGSALGSLVSQPPGTVVLVVRPPGSDLEIEVKRSGCRGPHPLSAVHARGGREVPPGHRLDGGSVGPCLQWEARSSARLARLYRRLHGQEAPISRVLAIASVYTVPGRTRADRDGRDGRDPHILDYFTRSGDFGAGFAEMRREMARAVEAGRRESGAGPLGVPGELGLTLEFLQQTSPRQAVLVDTSALRLDRLARYLAAGGDAEYFAAALGREPRCGEARLWADDLLAEALGEPRLPSLPYPSHAAYVAAAFAANRRRADRVFLGLSRQLGRLWGTVAALDGGSWGESFVARNVGLKSRWRRGRRAVELVAMDHDRLSLPARGRPADLRTAQALDRRYVLGEHGRVEVRGTFEVLAEIYRADAELFHRGRKALLAESRRARSPISFDAADRRGEAPPPITAIERRRELQ